MSWLFSYFSIPPPADAPRAHPRILEEPVHPTVPHPIIPVHTSTQSQRAVEPKTDSQIERPNRNKIILGAGLGFFAFSLLITRRSFARRRLASRAAFYSDAPGHNAEQSKNVSGAMEALEALNIATINVLSVGMVAVGGALLYFDINSMQDARRMLRGGLGVDGSGKTEQEAEEEFEEWMASTLSRKESKEKSLQKTK